MTMLEIYEQHNLGKRYVKKNYKEALIKLEQQGKIIVNPTASERAKNTFGDKVIVSFPPK
jgi:hypothetical protein